ncbi:MarR family winged helix-turn-helix transcriptional regulator [Streptomyces sp. NPDC050658]|uniref:MarR family winged helix-turn-helix transcriptional regulator n=1 Tax=unclassified Streptomyces TaxID=2593676 RepID=UPI003428ACBA
MSGSSTDEKPTERAAEGTAESTAERADALERLTSAGRANSAATVMFHSAVAARQGLSATENKTLDILERGGPLTAKELAEQTALAPASVTGLVDRLENKGFVRRVKHPTDKRRVLIEIRREKLADLAEIFTQWQREVEELCGEFTVAELETVIRFLQGATERQHRAAARLAE